jgi:nucleoid DNA-binding protein
VYAPLLNRIAPYPQKAVDAVFESIQEGLEEDGIVKIGQWGTYSVDDM